MTNIIPGGSGNDNLRGTGQADEFDLQDGGDDKARGLAGNDVFFMGNSLNPEDQLFGGKGYDTVELQGQFASHLEFTGATFNGIEQIDLFGALNYSMILDDSVVVAGKTMTIDTTTISSGHTADVNASDESNGRYVLQGGAGTDIFFAGAGDDVLHGGDGGDQLHFGSGKDKGYGGDGDDLLIFGTFGEFTTADHIEGGTGFDTVYFGGNLTVTNSTLVGVEAVYLQGGATTHLDFTHLDTSAIAFFQVDASGDTSGVTITTAGLSRPIYLTGSADDDVLIGGHSTNTFTGLGGADTMTGGPNTDRYNINTNAGHPDSTGPTFDTINGFDAAEDLFGIFATSSFAKPAFINATVHGGRLSAAHFDADLSAALGVSELGAADAVLFKPGSGTYKGQWFLVVDDNGMAGYQAEQDVVVRLNNAQHLGAFSVDNFASS